jgi:hypothetical protein
MQHGFARLRFDFGKGTRQGGWLGTLFGRFLGLGGRKRRGRGRSRSSLLSRMLHFQATEGPKVLADFFCKLVINGAGVRLLVFDPQLN